ncbi:MAG: FHA domain-containing protein [Burkholderiales bacterium]|nr:FHA domain-containing protein [Burkholderiales bacterium]
MALELRIAGPGIDVTRRIEAGAAPVFLGRDPECAICLPDPEKNVSRKHLSLWNEDGTLHFLVVSVVNGVELESGDVPPGARGVLPRGETMKIAEYTVTSIGIDEDQPTIPPVGAVPLPVAAAAAAAGPKPDPDDPWAALEDPPEFAPTQPAPHDMAGSEADPFGEWGFDTYGTDAPGSGSSGLQASGLKVAADASGFFQGLGMDPEKVGVLSQGELEAIGRLVRLGVLGLIELHKAVAGSKKEMRSEDRTMMASKQQEKNPLKEGDISEDALMQYLFGGRAAAAAGYIGPERAVRELLVELAIHEKATTVAARAVAEGVLKEFEPDALKARLLGGGARLFESARAWDAFSKDYAEQGEDTAKWVQRILNKYFTAAYVRETVRAKREGPGRPPSATR